MATEETTTYRTVSLLNSSVEEMGIVLRNLKTNEKIDLKLYITDDNYHGFYWGLRFLVLQKKMNICSFYIDNTCTNDNYLVVLAFFIQFIFDNNETKKFFYFDDEESMHLGLSTQLADAIRSNNHGQIEIFLFMESFTDQEGMQSVWDSLHDMGVQILLLNLKLPSEDDDVDDDDDDDDNDDDNNDDEDDDNNINNGDDNGNDDDDDDNDNGDDDNNNYDEDDERETVGQVIDLVSFSNNTTLKVLNLLISPSVYGRINMTTFFDAMKTKKEFEYLQINFRNNHFRRKQKLLVENMLLRNHSLTEVEIIDNFDTGNALVWGGNNNDGQSSINTLLNNNRDWKIYKAMPAVVTTDADETENAKRIKIRMLVNLFINTKIKPIMRDTIIFILLNEYGLVLVQDESNNDEGNENGIFLRPITVRNENKRKRC